MILGIGTILVAALFPVSIRQASTAADETTAAAVAWNAMNVIEETLSDDDLPPAPQFFDVGMARSFRDPQAKGTPSLLEQPKFDRPSEIDRDERQPKDWLWKRASGEVICAEDSRFAWVAFFRRDGNQNYWSSYAQIIIIVARAQEGLGFTSNDVNGAAPVSLQPRPVTFDMTSDGDGPIIDQVVKFKGGAIDSVAPGAFLVVARDKTKVWPTDSTGGAFLNGRVYRIGNPLGGDAWELSPESVYQSQKYMWPDGKATFGATDAEGFVVGKQSTGGRPLDLAAFSKLIGVRPK